MASLFLGGAIKVVVTWGFEGKPSVNVHFVLMDTPTTPVPDATLLIAANAMWEALNDQWTVRGSDEWSVDSVDAIDWSAAEGNSIQTDNALPIVGDVLTTPMPSNCAAVVSQRTDHTGRSRRGRNYIPGLNATTVTANALNADLLTDLALMYTEFRSILALDDLQHIVYSTVFEGEPRITALATPITGTIVDGRVDTQRRRLPVA